MKEAERGLGISAIIPTTGGRDLSVIEDSLNACKEIKEIIFVESDSVHGRYDGIKKAKYDIIYTQDDDCVIDVPKVLRNYDPGIIICNVPPERRDFYNDITLIGWGAVFDKNLIKVLDGWEKDELFMMECDRVFTALNEWENIEADIKHLDYYKDPDRMSSDKKHWEYLDQIKQRINEYRGLGV